MQIHEAPRVTQTSDDALAAGNVVTIEPGVYYSGWGGIRIEDVVVLRDEPAENLTRAAKRPVIG